MRVNVTDIGRNKTRSFCIEDGHVLYYVWVKGSSIVNLRVREYSAGEDYTERKIAELPSKYNHAFNIAVNAKKQGNICID